MRKSRVLTGNFRLALAAIALATAAPAAAAEVKIPDQIKTAGKVVFCTDIAFAPWEMINPETQAPDGFDIDIGAAVTKAMGVESEHKNISFDGLIPALQARQCDAIISGFYDKPERREVVDFANYAKTGSSLIVKSASDLSVRTLDDMSGKKVAVGVGTSGEQPLAEANTRLQDAGKPEIIVVPLPTSSEAFQQLNAGLVDAYFGSTDQAAYYNKQQPGSVKLAGEPLLSFPVGIATLRTNKDLHEAFQAAIAAIRSNGEYDAVIKKWSFEELAAQ